MIKTDPLKRSLGAILDENGNTTFTVWSPLSENVHVEINGKDLFLMEKKEFGFWQYKTKNIKAGSLYKFVPGEDKALPDPASLSQPDGVHGASQVVDLEFNWTDKEWKNPPLEQYIIYELHAGCFTQQGDLAGIEEKLEYLLELGINAIEIMPLAQFPGERNWGYDGVFPFAVQHSYGGARALQKLVDTCHAKGIAVILDVVYNHLGPEGNYLGSFAPYFTEKYKTPWGGAINFDDEWSDGSRKYFIENALMWFRDFHVDALRLDAVHAIKDLGPVHILQEIRKYTDLLQQRTGNRHYLIAETDLNDPRYIDPLLKRGYGMDAQWVDEFHHTLRVAASGEKNGYYSDFNGISHLAKSYRDAYVYDGQFSTHRKKLFGAKAENNPGEQFIVFSQNHDQVGNRMLGERSSALVSFEMQKLMAGAVLVSPFIPMLFMGEEWSETNPFLYFVSHTDKELADAVRKGRKEEFKDFHAEGEAPDPMDENTFLRSKLQWSLKNKEQHHAMLRFYTEMIRIRKYYPSLHKLNRKQLHVDCNEENCTLLLHRWHEDEHLVCIMNFSRRQQYLMPPSYAGEWHRVIDSAHPQWLGPSAAPHKIFSGKPGTTTIGIPPESIMIYSNRSH
jgi:maltooligosyltrehalose trehalohydrolase